MGFAYPAFSHDFNDTFLSQESAEEICGQVTDDFDREKCLMFFTSSPQFEQVTDDFDREKCLMFFTSSLSLLQEQFVPVCILG